ncbi:hypothetical protein B0H13DRAFT_1870004 [Mycena leptocephala]|nr:hypothetical protein B0H13DRAFT_1870004 [Mycena leptocephala]
MADQDGQGAQSPAQQPRVTSFKVPYAWDSNAPKFTSDDHEDLMTFVDHVNQILDLAGVTDDAQRKMYLTNYLPNKKKISWRALSKYLAGTYDEFPKEVYKGYPEIYSERAGTVELLNKLNKLCRRNHGITVKEEGKLRRFGIEFLMEFTKLLSSLLLSQTRRLVSINNAVLLRSQIPGLAVPNANANVAIEEDRKEDPIKLQDQWGLLRPGTEDGVLAEGLQEICGHSLSPKKRKDRGDALARTGSKGASGGFSANDAGVLEERSWVISSDLVSNLVYCLESLGSLVV